MILLLIIITYPKVCGSKPVQCRGGRVGRGVGEEGINVGQESTDYGRDARTHVARCQAGEVSRA